MEQYLFAALKVTLLSIESPQGNYIYLVFALAWEITLASILYEATMSKTYVLLLWQLPLPPSFNVKVLQGCEGFWQNLCNNLSVQLHDAALKPNVLAEYLFLMILVAVS